ncbi:MAG: carbonic anhydrase [Sandaracinus sp.]|nr:carbonic anhydrase [Sandaracinus sp.]MCB9615644.1 carbonic anhydrase [Sandaracinus sp.]MCB9618733.1 carbonic anhydrase [Sandaracinus sp.]
MPHRTTIRELLDRNRQWAESQTEEDPTYFARHAQGQTPPFLYIGCSDSRVPPTDIVGAGPGDLFVTRNIANLVKPDDVGMRSVLEYGVHVLKVEHVIVCGHTECGGVMASLAEDPLPGFLGAWLHGPRQLAERAHEELAKLEGKAKVDRMVELNVEAQVRTLAQLDCMKRAWDSGRQLHIHGWVYGLSGGHVRDLLTLTAENQTVVAAAE